MSDGEEIRIHADSSLEKFNLDSTQIAGDTLIAMPFGAGMRRSNGHASADPI